MQRPIPQWECSTAGANFTAGPTRPTLLFAKVNDADLGAEIGETQPKTAK
jgi:hypothetical protein